MINSIVSLLSDKFKTVSSVINCNLPSPLRDLYRPENEELTYPELMAVCEQVTLTITDDEIKQLLAIRVRVQPGLYNNYRVASAAN